MTKHSCEAERNITTETMKLSRNASEPNCYEGHYEILFALMDQTKPKLISETLKTKLAQTHLFLLPPCLVLLWRLVLGVGSVVFPVLVCSASDVLSMLFAGTVVVSLDLCMFPLVSPMISRLLLCIFPMISSKSFGPVGSFSFLCLLLRVSIASGAIKFISDTFTINTPSCSMLVIVFLDDSELLNTPLADDDVGDDSDPELVLSIGFD